MQLGMSCYSLLEMEIGWMLWLSQLVGRHHTYDLDIVLRTQRRFEQGYGI